MLIRTRIGDEIKISELYVVELTILNAVHNVLFPFLSGLQQ